MPGFNWLSWSTVWGQCRHRYFIPCWPPQRHHCEGEQVQMTTCHRWENVPSQPPPRAQHCQTTEEHQANNVLFCQQNRQVLHMQSWESYSDTRSWASQKPKPAILGAALAGVSCCGCNGEWPQGGSGVTDKGQLCGQRKGEVPGEMLPPIPRGEGTDGEVGQFYPGDGPWPRKGAGSSSPCTCLNDHLGFTCFRQSCSLKKGVGSWPAWKVLFEPSLFQWPANAEHLAPSPAFTLSDVEWMGRHNTVPWIYRNGGQRKESQM